jgi:hypothetical protein
VLELCAAYDLVDGPSEALCEVAARLLAFFVKEAERGEREDSGEQERFSSRAS